MPTMRVAKLRGRKRILKLSIGQFPSRRRARCESKSWLVAFATAIRSLKRGNSQTGLSRVPGHEVAGIIDAVGTGVAQWNVGQRVGVGWFGGNCGYCDRCRRGDFFACANGQTTGISFDGGYGEYMIAPATPWPRCPMN